jgi:aquaporin Z
VTTASTTGFRSPLGTWHDLEQAADRSSWSLYAAEFFGTALLLVGGLSAVILVVSPASPVAALALPGWLARGIAGALFGLTGTLVTLSALGRHSGAHLNPAMTLAFLIEGKVSASHAAWYAVSQLLGAIAGAGLVLVWGPVGKPLRYGATTPAPNINPVVAVALEVLCTVVLVGTVFVFLGNARLRRFTAWTMSPMYALMVSLEAPLTGTSTNPARSLGPAVVTGTWQGFWIYLIGPALGAAAGVALARALGRGERRVDQARIAPHPNDPLTRSPGPSRRTSASGFAAQGSDSH